MELLVTRLGTPSYPEIWLEIFSHLPGYELKVVALTCQLFRRLTQTYLYQHVNFHLPTWAKRMDMECMNFLTSAQNVHYIHSCMINLPGWSYGFSQTTISLLSYFSHFTHLTLLLLGRLLLSSETIRQLSHIKSLKTMILDSCAWDPDKISGLIYPRLTIAELNCTLISQHSTFPYPPWLSFLDLKCLRRVILNDPASLENIVDDLTRKSILPFLRILDVHASPSSWSALINLLTVSPALEQLVVRVDTDEDPSLAPLPGFEKISVPALKSYYGPLELLPHVSRGGQLRDVHIWSTNPDGSRLQDEFIAVLDQSNLVQLRSLFVYTEYLTEQDMKAIVTFVPQIKTLTIDVRMTPDCEHPSEAYSTDSFFTSLPHILPENIENLDVFWVDTPESAGSPCRIEWFMALKEHLVQTYPALRCIYIHGYAFTFFWKRRAKGPDIVLTQYELYLTKLLQDSISISNKADI